MGREQAVRVQLFDQGIVLLPPFAVNPVTFQVRGSTSSSPGLDEASRARVSRYETIDALFLVLRDTLQRGPHHFDVEYHATLGYPIRANLDLRVTTADDELSFYVSEFVSRQEP